LRRALGLTSADLVFVAGSTMDGEEEAALAAYRQARRAHPGLRLVLVPRHAERFDAVASWLEASGERVGRRTRGQAPSPAGESARAFVLAQDGASTRTFAVIDHLVEARPQGVAA